MTFEDIKKGEYETVEYKADIPVDRDKYLKTAVAFANGVGGKLIFGIKNNTWEIIGFSNEELFVKMDSITSSIYDSCEPKIVPKVDIHDVDGQHIIVVEISAGMNKPYYLKALGVLDGTFIRIAGTTRKAEK